MANFSSRRQREGSRDEVQVRQRPRLPSLANGIRRTSGVMIGGKRALVCGCCDVGKGCAEVDLNGEQRRNIEAFTRRYHAYFEAGMISKLARPWSMWRRNRCPVAARSYSAECPWSSLRRAALILVPPVRTGFV